MVSRLLAKILVHQDSKISDSHLEMSKCALSNFLNPCLLDLRIRLDDPFVKAALTYRGVHRRLPSCSSRYPDSTASD